MTVSRLLYNIDLIRFCKIFIFLLKIYLTSFRISFILSVSLSLTIKNMTPIQKLNSFLLIAVVIASGLAIYEIEQSLEAAVFFAFVVFISVVLIINLLD